MNKNEIKLSVVIPVYNEEKSIEKVVENVANVDINKEIIIIDDCSTDRTAEIIKNICNNNKNVKAFFHKENKGKGYSLRTGFKQITGNLVIIQDADLEYNPNDYHVLIDCLLKNNCQVVYGSRFMKNKFPFGMSKKNYIANKILNSSVFILFGYKITDEATCYKLFRTDLLKKIDLECKGFEFCPEITAKIIKKKIKIFEVPIDYIGRNNKDGKKIKWTDGLTAVWTLIKNR
jgi:dolichol-phosphate mannosyltransferase